MILIFGALMEAVAGWFGLTHHLTGHAITIVRIALVAGGLCMVSGLTRFL